MFFFGISFGWENGSFSEAEVSRLSKFNRFFTLDKPLVASIFEDTSEGFGYTRIIMLLEAFDQVGKTM